MPAYYLDTSALVKRYAREAGTAWITSLIDPAARHTLYTVRLTGPKLVAALGWLAHCRATGYWPASQQEPPVAGCARQGPLARRNPYARGQPPFLSIKQIDSIATWLDQGAKNN